MTSRKVLFVRNLPFRATDEHLLQAYSSYSPKRAFVVLDPMTKESRGFGYVYFSTSDDALSSISANVTLFDRVLHAKLADVKPLSQKKRNRRSPLNDVKDEPEDFEVDEVDEVEKETVSDDVSIPEGVVDPQKHSERRRCICIRLDDAVLYKILKSQILSKLCSNNLVSCVQPPEPEKKKKKEGMKSCVFVECPTRAAAVDCYMQLKEYRQQNVMRFSFSYMEQRVAEESIEEKAKIEPTDQSIVNFKEHRLIVRNLPFSVTEKSLKETFSKLGRILEIVLPRKADGNTKGFGFIQYFERSSAEKALETLNGSEVLGRTVAVDWAVPKGIYVQQSQGQVKMEVDDNVEPEDQTNENNASLQPKAEHKPRRNTPSSQKVRSDDIVEGRTVFIRGLSFSTEEATLLDTFGKLFGSVFYAKICSDDLGRSKGTGFVKFVNKEHADECIKQSTESPLTLDGRRLTITVALNRKDAETARADNAQLKESNDPRNLRLAAIGYIKQGSKEAEGMSQVDLQKRHTLYSANCAKLRNPVMFLSDTRLSVHNIPTSVDDKQLKQTIIKHMNDKTCRISECRVMRDLDRVNASGLGKSRGYAFVNFNEHKHAVSALEKLNNNPEIFGEKKRLIVQFSVENRKAVDTKLRRLEKSRQHLKEKKEKVTKKAKRAQHKIKKSIC